MYNHKANCRGDFGCLMSYFSPWVVWQVIFLIARILLCNKLVLKVRLPVTWSVCIVIQLLGQANRWWLRIGKHFIFLFSVSLFCFVNSLCDYDTNKTYLFKIELSSRPIFLFLIYFKPFLPKLDIITELIVWVNSVSSKHICWIVTFVCYVWCPVAREDFFFIFFLLSLFFFCW